MTTFTIFEANKYSKYSKQAILKTKSPEEAALEFASSRDVKDNTKLRVVDLAGRTTVIEVLRHNNKDSVFYTSLVKVGANR